MDGKKKKSHGAIISFSCGKIHSKFLEQSHVDSQDYLRVLYVLHD